jgi:hypothetical protein
VHCAQQLAASAAVNAQEKHDKKRQLQVWRAQQQSDPVDRLWNPIGKGTYACNLQGKQWYFKRHPFFFPRQLHHEAFMHVWSSHCLHIQARLSSTQVIVSYGVVMLAKVTEADTQVNKQ